MSGSPHPVSVCHPYSLPPQPYSPWETTHGELERETDRQTDSYGMMGREITRLEEQGSVQGGLECLNSLSTANSQSYSIKQENV